MIVCAEITQNKHRVAKHISRHCRSLSQRSCRLSRDRRQLSLFHLGSQNVNGFQVTPEHPYLQLSGVGLCRGPCEGGLDNLILRTLDGPAIRNANRGDSRESIRRRNPISTTFEQVARIASDLRFAIFSALACTSQKGFRLGTFKQPKLRTERHHPKKKKKTAPARYGPYMWCKDRGQPFFYSMLSAVLGCQ